ncbi:MAG: hypothetical protein ABI574_06395 [Burkholderiales bacterium]
MVNGFKIAASFATSAHNALVLSAGWLRRGGVHLGIAAACAIGAPAWAVESAPAPEAGTADLTVPDTAEPTTWQWQLGLATDTSDAPPRPAALTTALGWGQAVDTTGLALRRSAHRLGDAGWYAYVSLSPSLPTRVRQLLGKPEGGLTLEPRPSPGQATRMSLGSVLRWKVGDTGQMALRLRSGRIGLAYGTRFNL